MSTSIAALLLLCGAPAALAGNAPVWTAEAIWHGLHLADTLQTIDATRRPGYRESSDFWRGSGWLIGHHPNQAKVWGYMAGEAAGHAAVTVLLLHTRAPRWVLVGWEAITIGIAANTVAREARLGLAVRL